MDGQIQLYSIQQQINCKLIQTFPQEHPSSHDITSLLQINPNTLISSSDSSNPSYNSIVIWSKSKASSSSLEYEPVQRITHKETGRSIYKLVLIKQKKEEEEVFASCSSDDDSVLIWRRGKGGKGDKFQIKQKITNVRNVWRLLYISQTNELIFASSYPSSLLHIWSPSPSSSSSSSKFVETQEIQTSSRIYSLCQLNENRNRIEFASGHSNGQIMIWSKQQQINASNYSLYKTLKPFNDGKVHDIIFINYNEGFNHFLISCSLSEDKIKIFRGEEEEELEHVGVGSLIKMSNGQFASGGFNKCLNIWSPSSF
jgi:hypothetical protein